MEYLEFENPVKEIIEQIEKCKLIGNESEIDIYNEYFQRTFGLEL